MIPFEPTISMDPEEYLESELDDDQLRVILLEFGPHVKDKWLIPKQWDDTG